MKTNEDIRVLISLGELLTDGLVAYDLRQDKITYINAAGSALTGLQREDQEKQIVQRWQQVTVQDRAYLSAQYHAVLQEHVSHTAEFGILRDHEQQKFLHVTACVIENGNYLVAFIRDITQLREHEDYLVEFGAKKNTLLDTLTHNLSGSLNLTKHLTTQAEKHAANPTELVKYLSLISSNNEGSLKIIDDFLQYEHEKSPRIHVKQSRVDLVERIRYVHEQLQNSYPHRFFAFTSNRPEIHATTDDVKLLQVLNNLTTNAVKFSPADRPIGIHLDAKAEGVTISVKDQGIGIPEALKPLIFLRQPTTGRAGLSGEPSNGQGLAICKDLVEMLEGTISFESAEGKGSTFTISLPYTMRNENPDGEAGLASR